MLKRDRGIAEQTVSFHRPRFMDRRRARGVAGLMFLVPRLDIDGEGKAVWRRRVWGRAGGAHTRVAPEG